VFQQAQGEITKGPEPATVDGLPAVRFEASAVAVNGRRTQSQLVLVFDGTTTYSLNCQYTPDRAAEMKAGCAQAVASFQVESQSTATSTG
jgi:hypothetical protein